MYVVMFPVQRISLFNLSSQMIYSLLRTIRTSWYIHFLKKWKRIYTINTEFCTMNSKNCIAVGVVAHFSYISRCVNISPFYPSYFPFERKYKNMINDLMNLYYAIVWKESLFFINNKRKWFIALSLVELDALKIRFVDYKNAKKIRTPHGKNENFCLLLSSLWWWWCTWYIAI